MAKAKCLLLTILVACALAVPAVAQNGPESDDAAFARAIKLHESGDIEGAIRGYESILAKHPQSVEVRSNLGAAYSKLGRYEDAINQYVQALKVDQKNQTIRFNLALAYYKAAMFPDAADELTRFLAAAPEGLPQRPNAVLLLADCNVRLGKYKTVIESLSPLADADPNNRTVAFLLGSALLSDGQLSRGQQLIDRVFHDEDSAEAHLLLGSTLLYVALLVIYGRPDWGQTFSAYLGLILMGMMFVSIGLFFSACTQNQIVAYLATLLVLAFITFIAGFATFLPPFTMFGIPVGVGLRTALTYISVGGHIADFSKGVIAISHVCYFLGVTLLFLFFTYLILESRKWR